MLELSEVEAKIGKDLFIHWPHYCDSRCLDLKRRKKHKNATQNTNSLLGNLKTKKHFDGLSQQGGGGVLEKSNVPVFLPMHPCSSMGLQMESFFSSSSSFFYTPPTFSFSKVQTTLWGVCGSFAEYAILFFTFTK